MKYKKTENIKEKGFDHLSNEIIFFGKRLVVIGDYFNNFTIINFITKEYLNFEATEDSEHFQFILKEVVEKTNNFKEIEKEIKKKVDIFNKEEIKKRATQILKQLKKIANIEHYKELKESIEKKLKIKEVEND